MLGYQPIFCICCQKPKNAPRRYIPYFPLGPERKVISIKNETCQTKDPTKDEKNMTTPM